MSSIALTADHVSKVYRLHRGASGRVLDFLGIKSGVGTQAPPTHCALQDISFEIQRGETVGIIGRNGAGKSTLLRLLAGTSQPSSGTLTVCGSVSAVLELGSGFHTDLTGQQNIYASGLYLGLSEAQMNARYEQIVEFAELGHFLHQPVRTYSAGMYMRLAFSVATSMEPDILVVDEVLSVGDSYFARKCFGRIRNFIDAGRTAIFVSHDLAAVQRFCSRLLWIDQGKLVMDDAPLPVLKAYAASVRRQEAARSNPDHPEHSGKSGTPENHYGTGQAQISLVECLASDGAPQHSFSVGETFAVRLRYATHTSMVDPVFVVSIHRHDGVRVCQLISSRDGYSFGKVDGTGTVTLSFARPCFGPGKYVVSVAVFERLDLLDRAGSSPCDLHDRAYEFSIDQPLDCALDLGLTIQSVQWTLRHDD